MKPTSTHATTHRHHIAVVVAVFVMVAATEATAHHPVTENGIAAAEPMSSVEVSVTNAAFEFEGVASGSWRTLNLRGEYPLAERFSVGFGLPIVQLSRDYGPDTLGTGDADVYARYLIAATDHGGFLLTGGFGLGLPTGAVDAGLGSGHVEISPHLVASSQPFEHLIGIFTLVQRSSLNPEDEAGEWHGALVAPHQPHELDAMLAVAVPWGDFYAKVDGIYTFDQTDTVADPVRAAGELGWFRSRRWRISLRVDAPVAGQRRSGLRTTLSASFMP
jgi:hypothetical protein